MADFCTACLAMDGLSDFRGTTSEEAWKQGKAAVVLCEGCGPIQVDPAGNCVSADCLCKGEAGHGMPWSADAGTEKPKPRLGWSASSVGANPPRSSM